MPWGAEVGLGGADPLPAPHTLDALDPHQAGDLVAPDVMAGSPSRYTELAGAVDPVVVLPQLGVRVGPSTRQARADGERFLNAQ